MENRSINLPVISSNRWFEDILKEIESGTFLAKVEAVKVLAEGGKQTHALELLKNSLKCSKRTEALLNLVCSQLSRIKINACLSESLRQVHNHVCHFTTQELDESIRADLYEVNLLYEWIREMEALLINNASND
ncbi:hypothetical protein [Roseimarinus sediminis]|uniref:hypothetical protein n=1 Tax=Roseimarinus sediminis TaxID=1610899 RepID=UPI003D1957B6